MGGKVLEDVLDDKRVICLLHRSVSGCLATVGPEGEPYALPVHFIYKEGRIYIHSRMSGRKLENILKNPEVCFTVWEMEGIVPGKTPCNTGTAFESIVLTGRAQMLLKEPEKEAALNAIVEKYTPGFAGQKLPEERVRGTAVIEMEVTRASYKEYHA